MKNLHHVDIISSLYFYHSPTDICDGPGPIFLGSILQRKNILPISYYREGGMMGMVEFLCKRRGMGWSRSLVTPNRFSIKSPVLSPTHYTDA